MNAIQIFECNARKYDTWFENYPYIYQAELLALSRFLPPEGRGLEIGVGTGRFAKPLGITEGVEPAAAMAEIAEQRGISVYRAVAENLPFHDNAFDYVLMVTTLCFLQDPITALKEARRVLRTDGLLIIGFIDKNSKLGKDLAAKAEKSDFYRFASFYTVEDLQKWLQKLAFTDIQICQTLFKEIEAITAVEPVRNGYGEGSFVVISGKK